MMAVGKKRKTTDLQAVQHRPEEADEGAHRTRGCTLHSVTLSRYRLGGVTRSGASLSR